MKREYPQVKWWFHFHNHTWTWNRKYPVGMEAGFTNFDASFAGVGGCPFVPGAAGNVTTEDVLHMCSQMKVDTGNRP